MRNLIRFLICSLFGGAIFPAAAAFTSLYIFGDGLSTTTNSPGGSQFYGNRYSNGRVWVEVLAQRQGLVYESNKNWSFFGHFSPNLVTNVSNWLPPTNVNSSLIVVWVNNADFVDYMNRIYPSTNIATWTSAVNQSLTNHLRAITNLFAKGVRNLVMPNTVDITKVPGFVALPASGKSFVRQRVIDFNLAFAARLDQARASFTNLTIYSPDIFSLLDNLTVNPAVYGLTNALDDRGLSIDALTDPALADKSLNGAGTNYIYWDYLDPTAKAHAVLADFTQQLLSPVRISSIAPVGGSNRLDLANVPVGRNGLVEGSTNLLTWTSAQSVNSTNAAQTIFVPATDPFAFYRLRFPFSWSWP